MADFTPTCLIPSEFITLYKSLVLLSSIAFIKFCANFLPFFFNDLKSSTVNLYMSAMFDISFLSINSPIIASPSPSMFIASLEAKWIILLYSLAGHSTPIHLTTASPSSLTASAPQTGQVLGISNFFSVPSRFLLFTPTTSGITSPAFWIITLSPILMSFCLI